MILAGSELLSSPIWLPFAFLSLSSPPQLWIQPNPLAFPGWLAYFDHAEKPRRGLTDGFVWLRETNRKSNARQKRCDGNNSNKERRQQVNIILTYWWFLLHLIKCGLKLKLRQHKGRRPTETNSQTSREKDREVWVLSPITLTCSFQQRCKASEPPSIVAWKKKKKNDTVLAPTVKIFTKSALILV